MLERYLIIFIATTLIAISILTYFMIDLLTTPHRQPSSFNSHDESSSTICLRAECVQAASQVLEKLDLDAEPCIDFYEFACGNFMKTTHIPEDKFSVNMFSEIEDGLANKLNALLSSEPKDDETKPILLAKYLHSSCVDMKAIELTGHETMFKILDRLGGWPVLRRGAWNASWTWDRLTQASSFIGYSSQYIISFAIASDWRNSSKRILDVRASYYFSRVYLKYLTYCFFLFYFLNS